MRKYLKFSDAVAFFMKYYTLHIHGQYLTDPCANDISLKGSIFTSYQHESEKCRNEKWPLKLAPHKNVNCRDLWDKIGWEILYEVGFTYINCGFRVKAREARFFREWGISVWMKLVLDIFIKCKTTDGANCFH